MATDPDRTCVGAFFLAHGVQHAPAMKMRYHLHASGEGRRGLGTAVRRRGWGRQRVPLDSVPATR